MKVETLVAGRELDRLVAEKVMGRPWVKPTHGSCCTCQDCGHDKDHCACGYSEDIASAFEVVEKLTQVNTNHSRFGECELMCSDNYWQVRFQGQNEWTGADTVPLAICLAALKAVNTGNT